jgi:hypothetical protein
MWKGVAVANTLAYHDTAEITSVKSYRVQAPGLLVFIISIVKHPFGLFFRYCMSASSYLQVVLTRTDPHQQFSNPFKAGNFNKLRLVTFHTTATQRKCNVVTGSYQFRRNESSHDLDSQSVK